MLYENPNISATKWFLTSILIASYRNHTNGIKSISCYEGCVRQYVFQGKKKGQNNIGKLH